MAIAPNRMIIDHANGLHKRINNRRATTVEDALKIGFPKHKQIITMAQ